MLHIVSTRSAWPGPVPRSYAGNAGAHYPGTARSLHWWQERPAAPPPRQSPLKADRLLVGLLAGVAVFYLLGRALGLGRDRETHAEP